MAVGWKSRVAATRGRVNNGLAGVWVWVGREEDASPPRVFDI